MTKSEFIAYKIPILIKEGKYSKQQATAIAYSMFEKEGQKAQQGTMFNQTLPPQPKYVMPNFNQLPDQGYDFSYNNTFNPQPIENNTSFGQFSASNYEIPTQINFTPQSFSEYNQAQNQVEAENRATNPYTTNSVNILPPTQFGNPAYNLKQGMYNFGRGNTLGGIAGTGASLLGVARIGLSGYAEGKEDKRVGREYMNKNFDRTQNYQYGQQGGKVKNSDIIAQNAITDNPQQNNVNLEGNEFVMRTNGQVQPVIGDPHIENGKKADGVDAQLNNGDKVLSNYVKLKPADIKDLKERYDISLKRGATFAEAQKKLDQKLGIKKLETEKADILERIEKATKIKDTDSKQLSLEVLTKKTGEVNEKLNTLSGVRADNFEFLFQRQEKQEKIGDGTQLFDKNGKEVTESKNVAQQGGYSREETYGMNLMKIKGVQGGVTNTKLGDGHYLYHDKLPTDQGFDVNKNREFVTDEAYTNIVQRSPAYQEYMKSLQQPKNTQQLVEMQQGGKKADESFISKWTNSPMHLDMLKKSSPNDYGDLLDGRKENIKDISVKYYKNRPIGVDNRTGGDSDPMSGQIRVFETNPKFQKGIESHEKSHSSDNPSIFNAYKTNFLRNTGISPDLEYERLIPKSDINLINKYSPASLKDAPNYRSVKNAIDRGLISEKKAQEWTDYVTEPTETRARLNDLRERALDSKIYNPLKEKITSEQYNKLKADIDKSDPYHPLKQLKTIYSDQEIINLLNTVSNVEKQGNETVAYAQQGGNFEAIAKKHGISTERAKELMSFQQGGIQSEQEENEEGEASNAQEEQKEINPQEVIEDFAEATQQDPQQIIAQLQKMSPEEQQQALGQMMQALQQGQQNPQEEQAEGQMSNSQEEEMEVAQQGKYMQLAGKYSKKDQEARLNDFYNMTSGLGYEGKKEIGAMQNWMADNYPDEVVKYFTENGQPLTAKHVDLLKKNASWVFKNAGISPSKASADYTEQEKKKLNEVYGQGDENGMLHEDYNNFLLKGFRDNKWDWRFPMVSQKASQPVQGASQAQITAPSMARFASPQEEVAQEAPQTAVEQRQEQAATPSGVRNILPVYDTFLPPTSALEPIAKNTYSPYLYENKKMTVEPMLAEQARQAQTDIERAQQSGLSPQQQEAIFGQASAANQMAANDAIYKTETYNADNAWKTDMANVDALNKSQIMNTQYLNDFAQKSAASLANKETERYNNAYSNFMQDQADRKYTDQMNKANMMSDQFALTPNQGIIALNNKPAELPKMYIPKAVYDKMTAEEVNAIKKKAGATGMQLQIS